jgi:hypothetical protein
MRLLPQCVGVVAQLFDLRVPAAVHVIVRHQSLLVAHQLTLRLELLLVPSRATAPSRCQIAVRLYY